MKKIIIAPALLFLLTSLSSLAKEITPEEALERVAKESTARMKKKISMPETRLVHTVSTTDGKAAAYIFSGKEGDGFILLSADDTALPVLGYSDYNEFSSDNIPPQLSWWLSEYARQIEYAREKGIEGSSTTRKISRTGVREAIAPQLKTKWDQIAPYNAMCPLDGTDRTWTGCVATAMAQVLKYWEYPSKGTGQITYTIESLEKKVSLNFEQKSFDWENMLDIYVSGKYNKEEEDAVAYLMKACGYSVKMQYSMDASGALSMNIQNALTKYLGYDPNIFYTLREYYSSARWEEMIYDNLKNVGPILYGGGSMLGGGHSFVCDGYDGEGMFHFNWGWSGMSDGYFSLDALNPDALGTGGGSGGGYNFTQDAVFGIQPPTGEPAEKRDIFLTQTGALKGEIEDNTLHFTLVNTGDPIWANYNPTTLTVKFGATFEPQGGNEGKTLYHDISDKRLQLEPGYATSISVLKPSVNLEDLNLSDGSYKVTAGSVILKKGEESSPTDGEGFTPMKPYYGNNNYVILKVEGGKYSVVNDLPAPLKIKGEITGDLYYGALARFKVTVENTSDIDRISGFSPVLLDEEGPVMIGESVLLSIPAHSSVTREWTSDLSQLVQYIDIYLNKPLVFTFFNEVTYEYYLKEFAASTTLLPNPGAPRLVVTGPGIVDAQIVDNVWVVADPMNIEVRANLRLISGYFGYTVLACLCEPYDETQVEIVTTSGQNIFMGKDAGFPNTTEFQTVLSYPLYKTDQIYYLVLAYKDANGLATMTEARAIRFTDASSVNAITENKMFQVVRNRNSGSLTMSNQIPIVNVEAYDLTGMRVDSKVDYNGTYATVYLKKDGVIILKAIDSEGNLRTLKVN